MRIVELIEIAAALAANAAQIVVHLEPRVRHGVIIGAQLVAVNSEGIGLRHHLLLAGALR